MNCYYWIYVLSYYCFLLTLHQALLASSYALMVHTKGGISMELISLAASAPFAICINICCLRLAFSYLMRHEIPVYHFHMYHFPWKPERVNHMNWYLHVSCVWQLNYCSCYCYFWWSTWMIFFLNPVYFTCFACGTAWSSCGLLRPEICDLL